MSEKMRQVLIDIGNGRIKAGLAIGDTITEHREAPTADLEESTVEQLRQGWQADQTVLCSVVPVATQVFRNVFGSELIEVTHDNPALGIGIDYPKPASIGPDRLANAVALAKLWGAPGIVIDFGTAVTFDVVSAEHAYIGGVIAPGLRLMTDYLHERTALLPHVDLKEPRAAIGKSTVEAIMAGGAIGYRGMVNGILEKVRAELNHPTIQVVATGGDAAWIVGGLRERIPVDPDLTLQGLRLVGNLHATFHG